jgi:type II protein arginine methyltransferase
LAERVTVVAKPSSELRIGIDLPAPAEVLICEIFSVQVIAEGVLPTLEDAKARLLAARASVIPCAAIARAALVAGDELARRTRVGRVRGFDLSALNEHTPTVQYLSGEEQLTFLSAPCELFRFDLGNSHSFPSEKRLIPLVATAGGLCQGVVQWLRLELCEGVDFENQPGTPEAQTSRHWQPVLYPFPEPIAVSAGQTVMVRASHNRKGMHVVLVLP